MIDFELWLVYCAAAIGLSLTPGPNGLLVLTHGMRYGLRRAVFTATGGVLGFMLLVAASLAGLGALLAASEQAFAVAKWIGGAYLVYLGIRTWRAPPVTIALPVAEPSAGGTPAERPGAGAPTRRACLAEGFLVAVSNPKALIFFTAFLPQFMQPGVPFAVQFAVLGGTFGVVELVYELVIAGLAQRLAPWLGRHGRWFNRATGATFVGIGALLTTTQRG